MSRRTLLVVGETADPQPRRTLRPVTLEWSWQMYQTEPNACKWRAAVEWLRSSSRTGWHVDKQQERKR